MAHQDLKPSNVLVFDAARGSKISDLGRAWSKEMASPHDVLSVAGDWGYAPPEQLYRAAPDDPVARRYGCDLYHFGSMICFMFSQVHMNAYLMKHLAHGHRANVWGGSYDDVLPYVKAAFSNALNELETHIPDSLRLELIEMVRHLCEPDPAGRGDPQNRQGPFVRFSLNRYISRFDHLSRKAELHLRRK